MIGGFLMAASRPRLPDISITNQPTLIHRNIPVATPSPPQANFGIFASICPPFLFPGGGVSTSNYLNIRFSAQFSAFTTPLFGLIFLGLWLPLHLVCITRASSTETTKTLDALPPPSLPPPSLPRRNPSKSVNSNQRQQRTQQQRNDRII